MKDVDDLYVVQCTGELSSFISVCFNLSPSSNQIILSLQNERLFNSGFLNLMNALKFLSR